jgi:hypothetical protein
MWPAKGSVDLLNGRAATPLAAYTESSDWLHIWQQPERAGVLGNLSSQSSAKAADAAYHGVGKQQQRGHHQRPRDPRECKEDATDCHIRAHPGKPGAGPRNPDLARRHPDGIHLVQNPADTLSQMRSIRGPWIPDAVGGAEVSLRVTGKEADEQHREEGRGQAERCQDDRSHGLRRASREARDRGTEQPARGTQ